MIMLGRFLFAMVLSLLWTSGGSPPPLEEFIYPEDEIIEFMLQLDDERLDSALYAALDNLLLFGGENVLICRISRIEAPLGGYLFDGLFSAIVDGKHYDTFRIGIEDGCRLFVLIARGEDEDGGTYWYPPPGPDYETVQGEVPPEGFLEYEFLLDRSEFENLKEYYPLPSD